MHYSIKPSCRAGEAQQPSMLHLATYLIGKFDFVRNSVNCRRLRSITIDDLVAAVHHVRSPTEYANATEEYIRGLCAGDAYAAFEMGYQSARVAGVSRLDPDYHGLAAAFMLNGGFAEVDSDMRMKPGPQAWNFIRDFLHKDPQPEFNRSTSAHFTSSDATAPKSTKSSELMFEVVSETLRLRAAVMGLPRMNDELLAEVDLTQLESRFLIPGITQALRYVNDTRAWMGAHPMIRSEQVVLKMNELFKAALYEEICKNPFKAMRKLYPNNRMQHKLVQNLNYMAELKRITSHVAHLIQEGLQHPDAIIAVAMSEGFVFLNGTLYAAAIVGSATLYEYVEHLSTKVQKLTARPLNIQSFPMRVLQSMVSTFSNRHSDCGILTNADAPEQIERCERFINIANAGTYSIGKTQFPEKFDDNKHAQLRNDLGSSQFREFVGTSYRVKPSFDVENLSLFCSLTVKTCYLHIMGSRYCEATIPEFLATRDVGLGGTAADWLSDVQQRLERKLVSAGSHLLAEDTPQSRELLLLAAAHEQMVDPYEQVAIRAAAYVVPVRPASNLKDWSSVIDGLVKKMVKCLRSVGAYAFLEEDKSKFTPMMTSWLTQVFSAGMTMKMAINQITQILPMMFCHLPSRMLDLKWWLSKEDAEDGSMPAFTGHAPGCRCLDWKLLNGLAPSIFNSIKTKWAFFPNQGQTSQGGQPNRNGFGVQASHKTVHPDNLGYIANGDDGAGVVHTLDVKLTPVEAINRDRLPGELPKDYDYRVSSETRSHHQKTEVQAAITALVRSTGVMFLEAGRLSANRTICTESAKKKTNIGVGDSFDFTCNYILMSSSGRASLNPDGGGAAVVSHISEKSVPALWSAIVRSSNGMAATRMPVEAALRVMGVVRSMLPHPPQNAKSIWTGLFPDVDGTVKQWIKILNDVVADEGAPDWARSAAQDGRLYFPSGSRITKKVSRESFERVMKRFNPAVEIGSDYTTYLRESGVAGKSLLGLIMNSFMAQPANIDLLTFIRRGYHMVKPVSDPEHYTEFLDLTGFRGVDGRVHFDPKMYAAQQIEVSIRSLPVSIVLSGARAQAPFLGTGKQPVLQEVAAHNTTLLLDVDDILPAQGRYERPVALLPIPIAKFVPLPRNAHTRVPANFEFSLGVDPDIGECALRLCSGHYQVYSKNNVSNIIAYGRVNGAYSAGNITCTIKMTEGVEGRMAPRDLQKLVAPTIGAIYNAPVPTLQWQRRVSDESLINTDNSELRSYNSLLTTQIFAKLPLGLIARPIVSTCSYSGAAEVRFDPRQDPAALNTFVCPTHTLRVRWTSVQIADPDLSRVQSADALPRLAAMCAWRVCFALGHLSSVHISTEPALVQTIGEFSAPDVDTLQGTDLNEGLGDAPSLLSALASGTTLRGSFTTQGLAITRAIPGPLCGLVAAGIKHFQSQPKVLYFTLRFNRWLRGLRPSAWPANDPAFNGRPDIFNQYVLSVDPQSELRISMNGRQFSIGSLYVTLDMRINPDVKLSVEYSEIGEDGLKPLPLLEDSNTPGSITYLTSTCGDRTTWLRMVYEALIFRACVSS